MGRRLPLGLFIRTDRVLFREEVDCQFRPVVYDVDLDTKFSDHRWVNKTGVSIR